MDCFFFLLMTGAYVIPIFVSWFRICIRLSFYNIHAWHTRSIRILRYSDSLADHTAQSYQIAKIGL